MRLGASRGFFRVNARPAFHLSTDFEAKDAVSNVLISAPRREQREVRSRVKSVALCNRPHSTKRRTEV